MDSHARAANGEHTTHGVPHGYSSITPFLVLNDAQGALDFYRDVFGARVLGVSTGPGPDGRLIVVHAEVAFPSGRLQLGDANPAYGLVAPESDGDTVGFSLALYTADVDAVIAHAVERGAVVREPIVDFVSGDRFGSIRDPFGVRWNVMARVEDLSQEESDARVAAWVAEQGS